MNKEERMDLRNIQGGKKEMQSLVKKQGEGYCLKGQRSYETAIVENPFINLVNLQDCISQDLSKHEKYQFPKMLFEEGSSKLDIHKTLQHIKNTQKQLLNKTKPV